MEAQESRRSQTIADRIRRVGRMRRGQKPATSRSDAQIGRLLPGSIEDQELLHDENGDNKTDAAG